MQSYKDEKEQMTPILKNKVVSTNTGSCDHRRSNSNYKTKGQLTDSLSDKFSST